MESATSRIQNILTMSGLVAVLAVGASQSFAIDTANASRPNGALKDPGLVVSWPATEQRAAVTFSVPGEYLHEGTTWREKDGSIKSFSVAFELPGPMPVQDRPWLKGKKGTPEYAEFMKTWQGRFYMDVGRNMGGAQDSQYFLKAFRSGDQVRDADVNGLERYSTLRCYSEGDFKKEEIIKIRKFLAEKEKDDTSPSGCRFDRKWSVLVSPPDTAEGKGVGVSCMSTGCKLYFSVAKRGAAIGVSHKDVNRWPQIINPARKLLKSFMIR